MKKFGFSLCLLMFLGFVIPFTSCEVGLGESVDVQPPVLGIEYPEADVVIRGPFRMTGQAKDETALKSVTLVFTNTSTKQVYPSEGGFEATIDNIRNTWNCILNNPVEKKDSAGNVIKDESGAATYETDDYGNIVYPIPDGKYEVKVTAQDNSGRTTSQTRSYSIDNTAPLLIMTRPSTKGEIDSDNIDTYGQKFSISGEAADDNQIVKMVVKVYDQNNELKNTIELNNIPATVDLNVAERDENSNDGDYEKIYDVNAGGTQYFWCEVSISDNAYSYLTKEPEEVGNSRTIYYLYNDIYKDIRAKYSASDVYHMMNGTYEVSDAETTNNSTRASEKASAEEVERVLNLINSSTLQAQKGTFSLNPQNNPTYSLTGYDSVTGTLIERYNELKSSAEVPVNSPIIVKVSAGLDKASLEKDSLGFYLMPYVYDSNTNTAVVDDSEEAKIWLVKPLIKKEGSSIPLATTDEEKNARKQIEAVGSYDYNISTELKLSLDDRLSTSTVYSVGVVGYDQSTGAKEFVNSNAYGFYLVSSGAAPTINAVQLLSYDASADGAAAIVNDESKYSAVASMYVKKGNSVAVIGKYTAEDTTTISLKIKDEDDNEVEVTGDNSSYTKEGSGNKQGWDPLIINKSYFNQDETKTYTVTVVASTGSRQVERQFTVVYDVDGPIIEDIVVTPTVESNEKLYINGKINVKLSAVDSISGVDGSNNKPSFRIYSESQWNAISSNPTSMSESFLWEKEYSGSFATVNESIYTHTELASSDESNVVFVFVVYDNAGNVSYTSKNLRISQVTDKPTVELTNAYTEYTVADTTYDFTGNEYPRGSGQNIFVEGAPLTVTISDDDGTVSNVKVVVITPPNQDQNNPAGGEETIEYTSASGKINSNPWPLTFNLPTAIGSYQIKLVVTDNTGIDSENNETTVGNFWIKISKGAPTITIDEASSGRFYGKNSGSISVTGKVQGLDGLVVYRDYDANNLDAGKISGAQPNENVSTANWEDVFEIPSDGSEYDGEDSDGAGRYKHIYTVRDSEGRTSTAPLTYYIDNSAPAVVINEDKDDFIISSSSYKFNGTATDTEGDVNSGVSSVYYKVIAGEYNSGLTAPESENAAKADASWTKLSGSASWNFWQSFIAKGKTPAENELEEGKYTLYVCAYDVAQNGSNLAHKTFTSDLSNPSVTTAINYNSADLDITNVASSSINKEFTYKFTISDTLGLAETPYTLSIIKNGNPSPLALGSGYTVDYSNGSGIVTLTNCEDATYSFILTAEDTVEKQTTITNEVILDTLAPVISFTSPVSGVTQTSSTVKIYGTATDANSIKGVYYKKADSAPVVPTSGDWTGWDSVTGTNSWNTQINAEQGEAKYYFAAVDAFGNYSSASEYILRVDSVAPVIGTTTFTQDGNSEACAYGDVFKKNTNTGFTLSGIVTDNLKLKSVKMTASDGTSETALFEENLDADSYNWTRTFVTGDAVVGAGQTKLTDGNWTLTLLVTDTANFETKKTFTVIIDTTAPEVTITNTESVVSSSTNKFTGTADDSAGAVNSGIEAVKYQLLGSSAAAPTKDSAGWESVTSGTSSWIYDATSLPEGEKKLYVIALDKAGNYSSVQSYTFTCDTANPDVKTYTTVNSSDTERTNAGSSTIIPMNLASKDFTYKFTVTDSLAVADTPYTFSLKREEETLVALVKDTDYTITETAISGGKSVVVTFKSGKNEDGTYVFTVTGKDKVGKETTVINTIVLDTVAPEIEITSPDSSWQTKKEVTIRGTTTDSNSVKAVYYTINASAAIGTATDGSEWTNWTKVTGTTSWNFNTPNTTAEGENVYYFAAVDSIGNISSEKTSFTLKVDVANPVLSAKTYTKDGESATALSGKFYTNKDITFAGTVTDTYKLKSVSLTAVKDSSTVQLLGGNTGYVSVTGTSADWETDSITVGEGNTLVDGEWTLTLTVTDDADKTTSESYTMVVDTVAPSITSPAITYSSEAQSAKINDSYYYKDAKPTLTATITDSTSGVSAAYYLATTDGTLTDETVITAGVDSTFSGSSGSYSKLLSLNDGDTYVYIKAEDQAGNVAYYGTSPRLVAYVDTTNPVVTFTSPDVSSMLSTSSACNFTINVSDELSDLNTSDYSVTITGKTGQDKSTDIILDPESGMTFTDGVITGIFSQTNMSKITSDSATINVSVKDGAGNENSTAKLTLTFDNTPPTVTIVNPAADTVNGSIGISGTAKDNVGLAGVKLYRSYVDSKDSSATEGIDAGNWTTITVNGESTKVIVLQNFSAADSYNWVYGTDSTPVNLDVSGYDGSTIKLYVVAEDTAQNVTVATKELAVDQDSDRPEIKFQNLNLAGMLSTNAIWHKSETIYGTVTDDDGVLRMYISEDGGTNWSADIYDSGSWTYTFEEDETKKLAFKVVDSANGVDNPFVSATGSANMGKSPKLYDSQSTPNKFGYKVDGSYPDTSDTYVYMTLDTKDPVLKTAYYLATTSDIANTYDISTYPPTDTTYGTWKADSTIKDEIFGGTGSYLYLIVPATDANGLDNIVCELGGVDGNLVEYIDTTIDGVSAKICLYKMDVSSGDGYKTLKVTAQDKADRKTSNSYTVTVDNSAPQISITSHKNGANVYGSKEVNIRGAADDISSLYLNVTKTDDVPSTSAASWQDVTKYTSCYSFSIKFIDGSNSAGSTDYNAGLLNNYYADLYEAITDSSTTQPLYIWLYGKDALGNASTPVSCQLMVNPNGNKPVVYTNYPAESQTVGGTIRVTGTSEIEDGTISKIYIQIDPTFDVKFNNNWDTELSELLPQDFEDYNIVDVASLSLYGGKAIEASGTVSWNQTINASKELIGNNSSVVVAVRAFAVGGSGKVSEPALTYFTIDANSPVIGDANKGALRLVQYENGASSGTVVRSMEYTQNMWISGQWYLTGSVYDDSGLGVVKLNGSTITGQDGYMTVDSTNTPISGTAHNYQLNIPVGRTTGYGSLEYTIYVQEATEQKLDSSITLNLNYDNTLPVFTSTLSASGNVVQQSNGTYKLTGTVTENGDGTNNQSGFSRIAMYLTRTIDDKTYVLDPMVDKGDNSTTATSANAYEVSDSVKDDTDGWYYVTGTVDSVSGSTVTLKDNVDSKVRPYSICKINDVIFTVISASEKTITLDSNPVAAADDTVYFALAQVIDHVVSENFTTAEWSDSFVSTGTNDDGDQMCEYVDKSGTTWNWEANIHSGLILDGPVTINFVAYDKAGNISKNSYTGTVCNNQPRLAGVKFGNDDNLNGTVDESELITSFSALYGNRTVNGIERKAGISDDGKSKITEINVGYDSEKDTWTSQLNIKGAFLVRPEVVGGNSGIKYSYSLTKDGAASAYVTKSVSDLGDDAVLSDKHAAGDDLRTGTTALSDISLSVLDMISADWADANKQTLSFVLWDETEGTTAGTDSNQAVINICANVSLRDATPPTATISPFKWVSESDNSLFGNSRSNGHIELEGDLPTDTFKDTNKSSAEGAVAPSGEYDRDPKVSGKIVIRGSVSDNVILDSLTMTIPGFNSDNALTLGTYTGITESNPQGWTAGSSLTDGAIPSAGWAVEFSNNRLSNTSGHTVDYTVYFDTSEISEVCANDVAVTVSAKDKGKATVTDGVLSYVKNTSASSTTQTTSASQTSYYRMDVVPYIGTISTSNRAKSGLKDNNIRSASGKYSIMYAADTNASTYAADFITVKGFNLNPSAVRVVDSATAVTSSVATDSGIAATASDTASDYTSFSLANTIANSGYLEVFTNGVRSLNNINENDAHDAAGSGSAIGSAVSDYANYYNREPDYYTTKNVQLTDDRYLVMFDMHTAQTPDGTNSWKDLKNAYYPVMIMNGDNPVFGYMNGSGGPSVNTGTAAGTGAGGYYASHAMPQRAEFNGTSGAEVYTEYLIKASAWDGMGMAVDEGGRYYNVSSYNRDGSAMSLIYDRYAELHNYTRYGTTYYYGLGWGAGTGYANYSDYSGNSSDDTGNNAITLDNMNYSTGVLLGRYMYPKLIANGNSKTGNAKVYMAYYDDGTGQIAFRNFQIGTSGSTALDSSHKDKNGTTYKQYVNFTENTDNSATYSTGRLTAVAAGSKYYDMAVTSDNHVVIVYYDEDESKLKLIYSTDAVDGSSPTANVAWTTSSVSFPSYAGTYVSITVDSSDGIHIAAFDASDADLKYFYLPSYSSTDLTDLTVDAAGSVGHWTGIAICTDSSNTELYGKPVISYYNSTETGTRESIKMAYPKSAIGSIEAGVDANGYTTGNWEYMTVPAITPPQGGDAKFQKVCLGFDTSGTPVLGFCATNLEFGKQRSE